jgi:hypothetical protein
VTRAILRTNIIGEAIIMDSNSQPSPEPSQLSSEPQVIPQVNASLTNQQANTQPTMPAQPHLPAESGPSGLAIAGLVAAMMAPPIGLILSIMGYRSDKQQGHSTTIAMVGLIMSIIGTIVIVVVLGVMLVLFSRASNTM